MSAQRSAALVRRWVALYTLGLPPEVKQGRRDEIDDDLWCQAQEAAESSRADRSLAGEIVARFVLGIPADLSWRAEQSRRGSRPARSGRSFAMNAPGRGLLAILGGFAWTIWPIPQGFVGREWPPDGPLPVILMLSIFGGTWMLAAATIGLAFAAEDRIRPAVLWIALLGAVIGAFSVLGPYGAIVALPIASAAVLWELRRIGAVGLWTATAHILMAGLALVAIGLVWVPGFLDNRAVAVPGLSLAIPFGVSWITIGWPLLRGRSIAADGISDASAA